MSDYFEIGYFQLENLMINQVQFYFFDLNGRREPVSDEPLKSLLKTLTFLEPSDIEPYLKEKGEEMSVPIVLMCDDGVISKKWGTQLSEAGFINVNIIENGFTGLQEEARAMTHS